MNEKRLAKILALLAQAESTNHPEEAKTFSAKAQELMTQWEIDEAELAAAAAASGSKVQDLPADEKFWIPGVMTSAAVIQVWMAACGANGVRAVSIKGWKPREKHDPRLDTDKGTWLHLFGFEHNIEMAKMLAASLLIQCEREYTSDAVQYQARLECYHPAHYIRWKNGFVMGFASGAHRKLQEAKRQTVKAAGSGAELALRNRDVAVVEHRDKIYPKLGKATTDAGQGAGSARGLGYEAGRRAQTGSSNAVRNTTKGALQ